MTYSFEPHTRVQNGLCILKKGGNSLLKVCYGLALACSLLFAGNTYSQGTVTLFVDLDGDGFGNPLDSIISTIPIPGFVTNADDCNDFDGSIHPGAIEYCDGIDRNCDGFALKPPAIKLVASDSVICEGESILIEVFDENDQPVFAEWNTGAYGSRIFGPIYETATFMATYTAENGCSDSESVTVTFNFPTHSNLINETPQKVCPGEQASLLVETTGPDGPWVVTYTDGSATYQFLQTHSIDTIFVTPGTTTTYELVSISSQFCDGFASGAFTVEVEEPLTIAAIDDIVASANNACTATLNIPITVSGTPAPQIQIMINGDTLTTMPEVFPVGQTDVHVIAFNDCGVVSETFTVTVSDTQAPSFASSPSNISVDNSAGTCGATVTWTAPEATDNCGMATVTQTEGPAPGSVFSLGNTSVTYVASDSAGNKSAFSFIVTVNNVQPVLSNVQVAPASVTTGTNVTATALVNDNNLSNVSINWGDGATTTATVAGSIVSGTHAYGNAGTYTVTVTAKDACNATHSLNASVTVTSDGSSSGEYSVTANGWFNSPKNAYSSCKNATGKAHFNIHAKVKGTSKPEGKATLTFQAGDLKFEAKKLESLVITGNKAVLKGTGELNCKSGYRFEVIMIDEPNGNGHDDDDDCDHKGKGKGHDRDSKHGKGRGHDCDDKHGKGHGHDCDDDDDDNGDDKLRFRIWNSSNVLVYDNQRGAADTATPPLIAGGSIIIKGSSNTVNARSSTAIASLTYFETTVTAFPNPFTERLTVNFQSEVEEDVNIDLLDVTGNAVYIKQHTYNAKGEYDVELGTVTLNNEMYLLRINQGNRTEILKVVHR